MSLSLDYLTSQYKLLPGLRVRWGQAEGESGERGRRTRDREGEWVRVGSRRRNVSVPDPAGPVC